MGKGKRKRKITETKSEYEKRETEEKETYWNLLRINLLAVQFDKWTVACEF